eukprot:3804321-Rhodomonas_salina.1
MKQIYIMPLSRCRPIQLIVSSVPSRSREALTRRTGQGSGWESCQHAQHIARAAADRQHRDKLKNGVGRQAEQSV